MKCIFLATLLLFFNDMKRDVGIDLVWIDSFFELQCYGAMLWFSRVRDSWWNKISFSYLGARQNLAGNFQTAKISWDILLKITYINETYGKKVG
jgi:hypothetical protein